MPRRATTQPPCPYFRHAGAVPAALRSRNAVLLGCVCAPETLGCVQAACTAFEACRKPVLAAVHGACVGAGVDMITACDMRICSASARFCVKEVDLAITADLGTLQRLPQIVGGGRASELALTARTIDATTALSYGLVTSVVDDSALRRAAIQQAAALAAKPTLAVCGTKHVLRQQRARSVQDGLEHVALWNAAMLWSHELQGAVKATLSHSKL